MSAKRKDDQKKLLNRISQRAYRRRQAESARNLENRTGSDGKLNHNQRLLHENRLLRARLIDIQTKLSRLGVSLQLVQDSVSDVLETSADSETRSRPDSATVKRGTSNHAPLEVDELGQYDVDLALLLDTSLASQHLPGEAPTWRSTATSQEGVLNGFHNVCSQGFWDGSDISTSTDELSDGVTLSSQQIPDIWTFQYQMGPQVYRDAVSSAGRSTSLDLTTPCVSNSPFSDHIGLIQSLLKAKIGSQPVEHWANSLRLYQTTLSALAMFNSVARPAAMAWYARTRFFHIVELTAWQLCPSTAAFKRLNERYRPTPVQMASCYPVVVDWIPFPSIRNKLIQLHAANPQIDQIFCMAVSGYVVEASMSELIAGAPPVKVYVRVTDLISAMGSLGCEDVDTEGALPAANFVSLFSYPASAIAAFKFLKMDTGGANYKMDPAFFETYPELYDARYDIIATGQPLRPSTQRILTGPKMLDLSITETYRSFLDFTLGAYQHWWGHAGK